LQDRYAALIMDCPPGMSLVSENIIHAADALVVPLLPSPLSARMLEQLFEFISQRGWHDVKVLPFFSMVDRRRRLHKDVIADLRARFPTILQTEVPYGSEFERMTSRRAPIESYAPANMAAAVYRALWREIDEQLAATVTTRSRASRSAVRAERESPTVALAAAAEHAAADSDLVGSPWSAGRE
jgi:cellulose biosynthesis protein BcsQ